MCFFLEREVGYSLEISRFIYGKLDAKREHIGVLGTTYKLPMALSLLM
jgi:hypothetical protein